MKYQKKVLTKLIYHEDDEGIKAYFEERARLSELLLHEEVYWKQRAKMFWIKEGDTNSRFFHAHALKRRN